MSKSRSGKSASADRKRQLAEAARRYREKRSPEKKSEQAAYMARYHREHRVRLLEAKKERLAKRFEEDPRGTWFRLACNGARSRAKETGVPYVPFEVEFPDRCPVFGVVLVYGAYGRGIHHPDSPSLDRIDPAKGYVPGNVRVICYRANQLRSNANLEEIRMIAADAERLARG